MSTDGYSQDEAYVLSVAENVGEAESSDDYWEEESVWEEQKDDSGEQSSR